MASRRIAIEYENIQKELTESDPYTVTPKEDNLFEWNATLKGPSNTPYENGGEYYRN